MQYFTKKWLKSACFSVMLFFALNMTGCSNSDDVTGSATNISPVATNDAFSADNGSIETFDLAANDSDADVVWTSHRSLSLRRLPMVLLL